jgi:serine/threonine-protein kinase
MKDNLLGTVVDNRFEIQKRIGEGGMGTVYQAWQRSIGREVALKMIDGRVATDVTAAKRFLREARLASKLSHPNTISMIDFGQCDDGRLFIAMELLRGKTLDKVIEPGPLPQERVLKIAIQICDALVAAHKLQIIHRDLKLENVMLLDDVSRGDFVKVLDFGLAKSLEQSGNASGNSTRAGIVVGTPQYLTPETMTGAPPTVSNDLYALGVMMGELSTGGQLWTATDFTELCGAKLGKPPELAKVEEPLRSLIKRLIAPRLDQRPADALTVASELAAIRGGTGAHDAIYETVPATAPLPRVEIQQMEIVEFEQAPQQEWTDFEDKTSGGTPIDIRFRRTPKPLSPVRAAQGSDTVTSTIPLVPVAEGTGAVVKRSLRGPVYLTIGLVIALLAAAAIIYVVVTPAKHKAPPAETR